MAKEKDKNIKVEATETNNMEESKNQPNEDQQEDVEPKGVIPEGMDFRKFIGCGG